MSAKVFLYSIGFLGFIGCTSEKAKQEKFVLDTIQTIKTENAAELFNLHLSHEKAAELGMYLFAANADVENSKSPKDFIENQKNIGLKHKPEHIQQIKNYFSQTRTTIPFSELELVGYTFHKLEEIKVTNLKSRERENLDLYTLKITFQSKNKMKILVTVPQLLKLKSKYFIYSSSFPAIVISKQ